MIASARRGMIMPLRGLAITFGVLALTIVLARRALAIDFYEIQIYPVQTAPLHRLTLELHSNSVTTASGSLAHEAINPYQIHETLEATYGVLPYLEVGQYFATARLNEGVYEYVGSRSKLHFGVPQSDNWPLQIGGNIELDYMRRAAEENPFTLELRPIVEKRIRRFTLIANLTLEKPFSGPRTHRGVQFAPSGEVAYDLVKWLTPALEYYGDMGALEALPGVQRQQHFIVPTANLHLLAQLEFNIGVGIGVTHASNGLFVKSIVGWTF